MTYQIQVSPSVAAEVLRDPATDAERNLAETVLALREIIRQAEEGEGCPFCGEDTDDGADHLPHCRRCELVASGYLP